MLKIKIIRQREISTRTWCRSITIDLGALGFIYRTEARGYASVLRRWTMPVPPLRRHLIDARQLRGA